MALVSTSNTFTLFQGTVDPLIKALQPGVQLVDSFAAGGRPLCRGQDPGLRFQWRVRAQAAVVSTPRLAGLACMASAGGRQLARLCSRRGQQWAGMSAGAQLPTCGNRVGTEGPLAHDQLAGRMRVV